MFAYLIKGRKVINGMYIFVYEIFATNRLAGRGEYHDLYLFLSSIFPKLRCLANGNFYRAFWDFELELNKH